LFLNDFDSSGNVGIRECGLLSGICIYVLLGNLEGFLSPQVDVKVLVLRRDDWVFCADWAGNASDLRPWRAGERKSHSVCVFVDHWVPGGVEVCDCLLAWETEVVAALVTLGVLAVDSRRCVEWLVKVSNIVDEETESIGLCLVLIGDVLLDSVVHKGVLVAWFAWEPVDDDWNSSSHVLLWKLEVRIVLNLVTCLVKVWGVDEMPFVLPGTSGALDEVGKGGAFNEWVAFLWFGIIWLSGSIYVELVVGSLEGVGSFLLEVVVSDSSD
jgi:hypothetical protein